MAKKRDSSTYAHERPSRDANQDFSAQDFVDQLLTEGAKETCDETNESFVNNDRLPPFYDEHLFRNSESFIIRRQLFRGFALIRKALWDLSKSKRIHSEIITVRQIRGQEFYHKHVFSMLASKFYGLISLLSIPTILKILIFTRQSGSAKSAYKRYVATIFHMVVWYDKDFRPGSKLWISICQVRAFHNSASKRSSRAGINRILQKDMTLSQFGFMGFQLARSEWLGIHNATEEEWRSFLHVWRVVGYLMGIEDRFNLCKGSVQETREICNLLIDQVFRPEIEKKDKDFLNMARYICVGLWPLNPATRFKSSMCFMHALVQMQNRVKNIPEPTYFDLSWGLRFIYYVQMFVFLYFMPYHYYRLYKNLSQTLTLWFQSVLPVLAIYKFGVADVYVDIKI